MVNWKLFNRSKTKEAIQAKGMSTTEENQESKKQTTSESEEKPEEVPIKEYNETLYSKGSTQKQPTTTIPKEKPPVKRISWETAEIIEQNIDEMGRQGTTSHTKIDTEKKVDYILSKKKNKT